MKGHTFIQTKNNTTTTYFFRLNINKLQKKTISFTKYE